MLHILLLRELWICKCLLQLQIEQYITPTLWYISAIAFNGINSASCGNNPLNESFIRTKERLFTSAKLLSLFAAPYSLKIEKCEKYFSVFNRMKLGKQSMDIQYDFEVTVSSLFIPSLNTSIRTPIFTR